MKKYSLMFYELIIFSFFDFKSALEFWILYVSYTYIICRRFCAKHAVSTCKLRLINLQETLLWVYSNKYGLINQEINQYNRSKHDFSNNLLTLFCTWRTNLNWNEISRNFRFFKTNTENIGMVCVVAT